MKKSEKKVSKVSINKKLTTIKDKNIIENDSKVCLSDCDVTFLILKYLVPIFQYLSVEFKEYNMKLKTTKCLNTAVMLVYILGNKKNIKKEVEYCDTENITKRFNKINILKRKEKKKQILNNLKKDLLSKNIRHRYFFYILMTHTKMPHTKIKKGTKKKKEKDGWFPGHVFIIEKSVDCDKNNKYKIFQSYINKYDLYGHFNNNNNSMEVPNNDVKSLVEGIENILLKKTWNKKAVEFWKKLCYVKTDDLLDCSTEKINICFKKIKIDNCYKNILKFTNNALININNNIEKGELNHYDVDQKDNNIKVKSFKIKELKKKFEELERDISS